MVVRSSAHKERSTGPQRNENGEAKMSRKEKGTVAFVSLANHRNRSGIGHESVKEALSIRTFHENPIDSGGQPRASEKILTSDFRKSKNERQMSIAERIPNRWRKWQSATCTTV